MKISYKSNSKKKVVWKNGFLISSVHVKGSLVSLLRLLASLIIKGLRNDLEINTKITITVLKLTVIVKTTKLKGR